MLEMVLVPRKQLIAAIKALRYKAENEAGLSQYPYLFKANEHDAWETADKLQIIVNSVERKVP
jgi:hypothetical protein